MAEARPALRDTARGQMTTKDAKISSTIQIWVDRFRTAQQAIRQLEEENERLKSQNRRFALRLEQSLAMLTDEQLAELQSVERAELPQLTIENSDCGGGGCGCSH